MCLRVIAFTTFSIYDSICAHAAKHRSRVTGAGSLADATRGALPAQSTPQTQNKVHFHLVYISNTIDLREYIPVFYCATILYHRIANHLQHIPRLFLYDLESSIHLLSFCRWNGILL